MLPPLISGASRPNPGASPSAFAAALDAAGGGRPEADGADGSGEAEAEAEVDPEEVRCNAALTLVAAVQGNRLSIEAAKKAGCVGALATLLAFGAESTPAYLCAMGLHALGYDHEKAQEAALGYDALEGGGRHSAEQANLAALRAVWLLKSEPQSQPPG